ncbi:unnamed protein product [Durusdinium trenchii]|uniref:Uncharacterized protein n=1 Tax=Durusdinium trenchii TaxID=1381693 RepID=A0ABP0RU23_9DINO
MSVGSQEPRLPPGGRFTVMIRLHDCGPIVAAIGFGFSRIDAVGNAAEASVTNNQSVLKYEALSAPNGVDAMVFVMRSGRITDDVIARLIYATEYLWGTECLLNLYIVAAAWIERQCELNWRFRHIYSLVSCQHAVVEWTGFPCQSGKQCAQLRWGTTKTGLGERPVRHRHMALFL